MAKTTDGPSIWRELATLRSYKRSQGRLARQLTAAALALMLFFGCYTLAQGWLAGFLSTSIAVRVTVPVTQADELEEQVTALAAEHGGSLARDETDRAGRQLIYAFPASKFWSTSPELQQEAKENIAAFRDAVEENLDSVVVQSSTTTLRDEATWITYGIPLLLFALGLWIIWRLINWSRFADFLISVEAEMDKVSWPSRQELFRATAVVLATMFFLGMVLFLYDVFWVWLFQSIGILQDV